MGAVSGSGGGRSGKVKVRRREVVPVCSVGGCWEDRAPGSEFCILDLAIYGSRAYEVWNDTDGIPAAPEAFASRAEAEAFVAAFPSCFVAQGYYLTAHGCRIDPGQIALRIEEVAMITRAMLDAATEEMGHEVDEERVELAIDREGGGTVDEMRERLTYALDAFERAGGRGVDLAEEIDDLRILLAIEEP